MLRIDGIKTDLITSAAVGPLSWITEGTMDLEAELNFDVDEAEEGFENYYRNDQNVATATYAYVRCSMFSSQILSFSPYLCTVRSRGRLSR